MEEKKKMKGTRRLAESLVHTHKVFIMHSLHVCHGKRFFYIRVRFIFINFNCKFISRWLFCMLIMDEEFFFWVIRMNVEVLKVDQIFLKL